MGLEIAGSLIPYWQVFVCLGILFAILEVFVGSFFLLPIGIAFFTTGVVSPFLANIQLHIWALAFNLMIVNVIFYKYVRPKFAKDKTLTNVDSMVGKQVTVIETVDNAAQTGQVKLYGDTWRALSSSDDIFAVGETLTISKIDGNKVFVKK